MTALVYNKESQRYTKELPTDRTNYLQAWKLLESYSKIPADKIDAHVTEIVTFAIFHYPCIGRWRFLDLYITQAPEYPEIITRLKSGDKLLDVGCCFGHIVRQLVFDGAPAQNLAGTDLRPEFVELGYELFRDKETLTSQFVTGDALDSENKSLEVFDGKFDFVHAASFFHLFGWDDQVTAGVRVVKFLKPGSKAIILGRQVGTRKPVSLEAYRASGERRYHHNVETFQNMWDEIGEKTGTKWKATGELFERKVGEEDDDEVRTILRFAVFKLD
ncbi:uncharacterized protein LY89DRAFT_597057 [Mollisia scopiformis]|uniref:Methyltransferase domain-containing protein n=1 Tax=Mollisia scopiformis TaxID=149040 RepID=A0A132BDM4_MOLSC|nr:uncharacterized protein LY89DRAFT_597057 [Mollisia scopiformis]KUJ10089.1 hypothetical protein LY89DRAFT_597057 [Mollisia scopiformis]